MRMTYVPGMKLVDAASAGRGHQRAVAIDARVGAAIAACQVFLVVRILSVLLGVSLLPLRLPAIVFRLDTTHGVALPLSGLDRGSVLLVVAAASAVELYLVYRLADRLRLARFSVLLIESCAIVITTIALAFGAGFAILPLVTSVGATCLLLLNQVRWAFRLQPTQRSLTGRRQGGTFAGYAAPSLEAPKAPQPVGYKARRGEDREPQASTPNGGPAATGSDHTVPSPSANASSRSPLAWPVGSPRPRA